MGLLKEIVAFEFFTVNIPWVRCLGGKVVSVHVPRPLRINEVPSSDSHEDKDNQGHGESLVACLV